jgi:hypothetical protein
MTELVLDLSAISQAAVESENTSVDSSGNFKRPDPVAGKTLGRIREYVELGRFEPDAVGLAKGYSPAKKGYLIIELLHKRHQIEMGEKTVPHEVKVFFNKGVKATSNYKKLFKQINKATGGTAKTFVDLINKPFAAKVVLNVVGEGESKKTYANLENFDVPERENDEGDMVAVAVPELVGAIRLFLWENDTVTDDMVKAMWASIQNDGTYTKNAGKDNESEESLNFDQNRIMTNMDWEGSRTQSLVIEEDIDLGDAPEVLAETTETGNDEDMQGMDD